ncbi:MAG: septum formation initiator family protein [Buchnera aphidicola (Floraphis choui)]
MTVIKIGLFILLFFLQISFFIGKNGLYEYVQLYRNISQKKLNIFYLTEQNTKLLSEIKNWDVSNELIEEYARSNLGMIKKGESFYRIVINP